MDCLIRSQIKLLIQLVAQFLTIPHQQSTPANFKNFKQIQERQNLDFTSKNTEPYNQLFTIQNLKDALRNSHNSALGPDDIHYQVLKHLADLSLEVLFHIFNEIWNIHCGYIS